MADYTVTLTDTEKTAMEYISGDVDLSDRDSDLFDGVLVKGTIASFGMGADGECGEFGVFGELESIIGSSASLTSISDVIDICKWSTFIPVGAVAISDDIVADNATTLT